MTTAKKRSARRNTGRDSGAVTRSGLAVSELGSRLGASRTFPVEANPDGPFGAASLAYELGARLKSRGGRPSDPGARIRRLVPLKRAVWRELMQRARAASSPNRKVSAGQLAALLLEKSLFGTSEQR